MFFNNLTARWSSEQPKNFNLNSLILFNKKTKFVQASSCLICKISHGIKFETNRILTPAVQYLKWTLVHWRAASAKAKINLIALADRSSK
jgi:hypothetical protein